MLSDLVELDSLSLNERTPFYIYIFVGICNAVKRATNSSNKHSVESPHTNSGFGQQLYVYCLGWFYANTIRTYDYFISVCSIDCFDQHVYIVSVRTNPSSSHSVGTSPNEMHTTCILNNIRPLEYIAGVESSYRIQSHTIHI